MPGTFARMRELFPQQMTASVKYPRKNMALSQGTMPCAQCGSKFLLQLDDLKQCLGCMFRGKHGQTFQKFTLNGWTFLYHPEIKTFEVIHGRSI